MGGSTINHTSDAHVPMVYPAAHWNTVSLEYSPEVGVAHAGFWKNKKLLCNVFCEIQKTTNEKGLTCRYKEPRMILRAVPRLWALRINCIKTSPPYRFKDVTHAGVYAKAQP